MAKTTIKDLKEQFEEFKAWAQSRISDLERQLDDCRYDLKLEQDSRERLTDAFNSHCAVQMAAARSESLKRARKYAEKAGVKNVRDAGRKSLSEEQISIIKAGIENKEPIENTLKKANIKRSTYFKYKQLIKTNSLKTDPFDNI